MDNVGIEVTSGARAYGIRAKDDLGLLINIWMPGAAKDAQCSVNLTSLFEYDNVESAYPKDLEMNSDKDIQLNWVGPIATIILIKN